MSGTATASLTGRLPFPTILQVAGIDSLAFPVLGAGSGGFHPAEAKRIMVSTFARIDGPPSATLVRFRSRSRSRSAP